MDAEKAAKKMERVVKENAFNAEEDSKTIQRQQTTIDLNNTKMKTIKRNMDDTVRYHILYLIPFYLQMQL